MKKIFTLMLAVVLAFVITGCKKDEDYKDYMGYQFAGKDPWGTEVAVTIRSLEDDKLTWTFTDTLTQEVTVYDELTTELKDSKTSFTVKGEDDKYSYEYSGTLTLKDGKLLVEYTKGSLVGKSTEGGSSSHNVEAVEESNRTVTLTKVVDNS